ncbi:class I SAM-dependent methyltransferase [Candidatus Bathyarchaeota archaeon]|nr:class I SAM-dependent methyltransferase [Candidatus Bathyarchaeota archaeon]
MLTYRDVVERASIWSDIKGHLLRLYDLTVKLPKEKIVVELGVRWGNSTTALLAAVNDSGGRLYSVDVLSPSGGATAYMGTEPNWTFILGDDINVVKTWDKPIDHLFIDTTHKFEHTLSELREWGKWVNPEGIITLHDASNIEVMQAINRFMEENPDKYELTIFEGSYGLALLRRMR